MTTRRKFNLQLFAETPGAGTGAPDPGPEGAAPAAGTSATPPAAGGEPGEPAWTPEKDVAFGKRLAQERAKIQAEERTAIEAELRKQYASHIKLGEALRQSGYDPGHLMTEWERQQIQAQAQQAGVDPQLYQQFQQMQQEIQSLKGSDRVKALDGEATALRQEHGSLFDQYAQQALDRATRTGETLNEAFGALAWREIAKAERGKAEQEVLARVTGRDAKGAPVNAGGGPGVTPENDVRKMPKDQFEQLIKDVKAGRRTSL
jgi:hypothetical protein